MTVAERMAAVATRMAAAAKRAGRSAGDVQLVAVSKRHPATAIREAFDAGQRVFGENFAQELVSKQDELHGIAAQWHFIGRLQRNKVKYVVGRVGLIHSVDSVRLAEAISLRAAAHNVEQAILVSVNIAGEASKTGVPASVLKQLLAHVDALPSIRCEGLMAMPPWPDAAEDNREYFRALRQLRDDCASDEVPLSALSMGTTGDYEVAIEEGATLVRLGTSIFGERPTSPAE